MRVRAFACPLVAACLCAACSSASPGPSGTQTVTETFSGSTQTSPAGTCGPTSGHPFLAGDGTVVVVLQQATPGIALQAQICYPNAVNEQQTCSIPPFVALGVGQPVSATLKSGRNQVLVVYPSGCGTSGASPTGVVSYTVTVTHPS
jgi:hypothetical protein